MIRAQKFKSRAVEKESVGKQQESGCKPMIGSVKPENIAQTVVSLLN